MQQPHAFAEIHPDLARRHGIADSEFIELRTRRGAGVFRARVTDVVRPDTIFAPFHWAGRSNVNAMTNPVLDRFSKMPAFKVCAVALHRIGPSDDDPSAETSSAGTSPQLPRGSARLLPFAGVAVQDRREKELKE
jgi:assimilatory nitrate reductase catalytic subunit